MQTIPSVKQQISDELDKLSVSDQEKVLAFLQTLPHLPEGIPGKKLVEFFQQFSFTEEETQQIKAIYNEID
jgi:hypothetical protein